MATSLTLPAVTTPALITEDERLSLAWPERAKALKIVDAHTLAIADEERGACKDLITEAHRRYDPVCDSAYKTWQLALSDRKSDIDPPTEAIGIYDRGMKAFDREQKEKAAAEQRRIEREAYQKQLEEREKVVEHVEATGGSIGEVKSVIERAVVLPVAPQAIMQTAAAPVKAANSRVVEDWKAEITDMWAFCEFAVKNNRRELIAVLTSNKIPLGALARSTKGAMEVPGLRVWDEGKVASLPKKAGA